jgi:hypothetical protein
MQIESLMDYDQYIKVNNLQEVTSQAIYKSASVFNPEGLFSEEIFGQTDFDRSYTCAYIKLPINIFNPSVAKTIIQRSGGIIKKMAYGDVRCNLVDGKLVEAADGEYTGLIDLYKIWEKINIRETLTSKNETSLDILTKSPKRLLFTDKILVCPPNMRPIGIKNGKTTKNEINSIYLSILGLKKVSAHTTSTDTHSIYARFQDNAISIYTYIANFLKSKTGFLQKRLLAKDTMWMARNVISAPRYNRDKTPIGVFTTGYPMIALCSMFKPLLIKSMRDFFSVSNLYQIHPKQSEVVSENIENIYDAKTIDDLVDIFIKNPGSRFKKLYLDPEELKPIMFDGFDATHNQRVSRELTLTDVIYICLDDCVVKANRHAYLVRYPIGDYLGAFFTKIHILSTLDTCEMQFNGETYPYYPIIDPEASHAKVSTLFCETVTPSNSRLDAIGGDYDGDTVKSTGIFSDEANEQAEKLMYSKIYCIKPDCSSVFAIAKECLNGLYALTK